jgi:putative IMPACT (imprinted ancient) family translation regulator
LIVVVRYFGGTLLGTGGLIQAYKSGAEDELNQAQIIEKTLANSYQLHFDYSLMAPIMNAVKRFNLDIIEQSFNETAFITISIPKSASEKQLIQLKANIIGVSIDQVDSETKIGGLKIKEI